jgi:hypothetical protein
LELLGVLKTFAGFFVISRIFRSSRSFKNLQILGIWGNLRISKNKISYIQEFLGIFPFLLPQLILKGVQDCQEPEIRANWIRMLGILGCLLPEGLVKVITAFIVEICMQETDAWALSEAIDSLMDIFSDNDWNQIAYDLSLVAKSRELEKMLKTKVSKKSYLFGFIDLTSSDLIPATSTKTWA